MVNAKPRWSLPDEQVWRSPPQQVKLLVGELSESCDALVSKTGNYFTAVARAEESIDVEIDAVINEHARTIEHRKVQATRMVTSKCDRQRPVIRDVCRVSRFQVGRKVRAAVITVAMIQSRMVVEPW